LGLWRWRSGEQGLGCRGPEGFRDGGVWVVILGAGRYLSSSLDRDAFLGRKEDAQGVKDQVRGRGQGCVLPGRG